MPIPRVFVSSTCYDLRYIRESLGLFIKNMGFDPVLSEHGNIYYDTSMHVHDSVLSEVSNCQIFVLIIGGRFGNKFKDKPESIVNQEYRKAIQEKIPVFAVVEAPVYSEYKVYLKNKDNNEVDRIKIKYSEVDSCKIFDFMQEVENNSFNNALVPFPNVNELESYLRQQWAGLMYNLLTNKSTYERESEIFDAISHVEFLTKQLLNAFGHDKEKINAILYDIISKSELGKIEKNLSVKFAIPDVVDSENVSELFQKTGIAINRLVDEIELAPTQRGLTACVKPAYFFNLESDYARVRKEILETLKNYGCTKKDFLRPTKNPKNGRKIKL